MLSFNKSAIEDKITELAYQLHLSNPSFDGFMTWLKDFTQQLSLPKNLHAIGIDARDSRLIGELAVQDPSAGGNPVQLSEAEYASIFINAVEGNLS